MSLREDIKVNMKTEQEVCSENAEKRAKYILMVQDSIIREFKQAIIEQAKAGVKGNELKGTFDFGRMVAPYKGLDGPVGKAKCVLFSKYYELKYVLDETSTEMIKFNAIKKYAVDEKIVISLEIVPMFNGNEGTPIFDTSDFPKITAKYLKKRYYFSTKLGDYKLLIHYSVNV